MHIWNQRRLKTFNKTLTHLLIKAQNESFRESIIEIREHDKQRQCNYWIRLLLFNFSFETFYSFTNSFVFNDTKVFVLCEFLCVLWPLHCWRHLISTTFYCIAYSHEIDKTKNLLRGARCTVNGSVYLNWIGWIESTIPHDGCMHSKSFMQLNYIEFNFEWNSTCAYRPFSSRFGKLRIRNHLEIIIENGLNGIEIFFACHYSLLIGKHNRMCCHIKGLPFKVHAKYRKRNIEWKRGSIEMYL